jgi:hypothetical protein
MLRWALSPFAASVVVDITHQRPGLARRLLERDLIEAELLDHALIDARKAGQSLVRHLLDQALVPPNALAQAVASEFNLKLCTTTDIVPPSAVIEQVDADIIRQHHALPIAIDNDCLQVAIADPANVG